MTTDNSTWRTRMTGLISMTIGQAEAGVATHKGQYIWRASGPDNVITDTGTVDTLEEAKQLAIDAAQRLDATLPPPAPPAPAAAPAPRRTEPTLKVNKQGRTIVMGSPSVVKPGRITATNSDGTRKTVTVLSVGKTFHTDDGDQVYGYLDAETAPPRRSTRRSRRPRTCITGGNCSSFGDSRSCGAPDCDGF